MSELGPESKFLRLRYPGTCSRCGSTLSAKSLAAYDRGAKQLTCRDCVENPTSVPGPVQQDGDRPGLEPGSQARGGVASSDAATEFQVDPGVPGGSARREQQRRQIQREQRIRNRHPRLGGLILAISDEPQSTTAWDVGATGEELLGAGLDRLSDRGVRMLHDRRIPGSKANLDHIAITASGVYVIDAKRYRRQRPRLEVDGGLFRARTERLVVGSRDRTTLVAGMKMQVQVVTRAIEYLSNGRPTPTVAGVLCFLDADWPLVGGSFAISGIFVEWPKKTYARLTQPGSLDQTLTDTWHRELADAFPRA
ncbi:MAG TPA: nuclease-related domain-containing protein [Nocardioidaceae bacterium]|nr:nuclease-related domain-containing protein [Nocardioidaceae bacterium]